MVVIHCLQQHCGSSGVSFGSDTVPGTPVQTIVNPPCAVCVGNPGPFFLVLCRS